MCSGTRFSANVSFHLVATVVQAWQRRKQSAQRRSWTQHPSKQREHAVVLTPALALCNYISRSNVHDASQVQCWTNLDEPLITTPPPRDRTSSRRRFACRFHAWIQTTFSLAEQHTRFIRASSSHCRCAAQQTQLPRLHATIRVTGRLEADHPGAVRPIHPSILIHGGLRSLG